MGSPAKKAPKAKKTPKKDKKPAKKATHPKFDVMIIEAIKTLKEFHGSSRKAVLNYMMANYTIENRAKAQVRVNTVMKRLVEEKKVLPVLKKGKFSVNGSYRLGKEEKPKKKKAKKPAKKAAKKAKKPAAKKAKKPA